MPFSNPIQMPGSITIFDEGISITTNLSSIDFTGSGVSVSGIGGDVTANITGGGGGGLTSITEKIAGSQNGNDVDLTVSNTPSQILVVTRNGQVITPIADFTVSGSVVTILGAVVGEIFLVTYSY